MKKIYNAPSVEITNIQLLQMIADSSIDHGTDEEGSHIADSKSINFAEDDNSDIWGND